MTRDAHVQIRLDVMTKVRWQERARSEGLSLSAWIVAACDSLFGSEEIRSEVSVALVEEGDLGIPLPKKRKLCPHGWPVEHFCKECLRAKSRSR